MKIACVYHPRLHTGCGKFHFVADALRSLRHDVVHVETMDDLRRADQVCDLVLHEQRGPASLCLADLREFLPRSKAFHVQWYFDLNVFENHLPIQKQPAFEPFLEIARGMDLVLIKERDRLDEYRAVGVNAKWFDQGCPSAMRQADLKEHPEFDVVLWGSSSRPMWAQRWEDVETLVRAGFKVAWGTVDATLPIGAHRLPGCQPLELPSLIEQAKVTLVVDARQDIPGYWSDRIWLAAGAGACIVRRGPTVDQHGSNNLPALGYFSSDTLVSCVEEFMGDVKKRKLYGNFARNMVMKGGQTYEARCQELVTYAQGLIDQRHENATLSKVYGYESDRGAAGEQSPEDAMSCLH